MEIKITCACGQDFKFEVEPVNGAMPCAVSCPACGADATQLANEILAQPAACPTSPQTSPSSVTIPDSGRLRINKPAAVASSSPANPESVEPAPAPPRRFYTRSLEPDKPPPPSEENIPMGILGGVIAGLIGMVAWYSVSVSTGRRFGIVAWLVGLLTGYGVRLLGRDGTALLGAIAAICATISILGGQFLEVNTVVNRVLRQKSEAAYEKQIESAKEGIDAKSEDEVRTWIANHAPHEHGISTQDIEDFRHNVQPNLQGFLDGKPSREQFERTYISQIDSLSLRYKVFNQTISLFTVLWVGFGIASAYRIGSA